MIIESPKYSGKITSFNEITGIITNNDELIPFHIKDFDNIFSIKDQNFLGRRVQFHLERNANLSMARNIVLCDSNEEDESKIEENESIKKSTKK